MLRGQVTFVPIDMQDKWLAWWLVHAAQTCDSAKKERERKKKRQANRGVNVKLKQRKFSIPSSLARVDDIPLSSEWLLHQALFSLVHVALILFNYCKLTYTDTTAINWSIWLARLYIWSKKYSSQQVSIIEYINQVQYNKQM